MSNDEKKPILGDSGIYISKPGGSNQPPRNQSNNQYLVIQPIEFDTRHRNLYGYLSFVAFVLILINYLMLKERACQFSFADGFTSYDLIQSFHITSLIVAIIVFVLSYFNFAVVIYEFRVLFYSSAVLMLVSAALLMYNAIFIVQAPCVSLASSVANGFIQTFGAGGSNGSNVFTAHDGIGIAVFLFDLISAVLMSLACRDFFKTA